MIFLAALSFFVLIVLFYFAEFANKKGVLPTIVGLLDHGSPVPVRPYVLLLAFNLIMLCIGVAGLFSKHSFGVEGLSMISACWFWVSIMARLVLYELDNFKETNKGPEKSNGYLMLKQAFSIGLFPKKGGVVLFCVYFFEVLSAVSFFLYLYYTYFGEM